MILKNKRGVSPLIATILLIAFAVALGAVVMNISSPLTNNNSTKQPSEPGCGVNVGLTIPAIGQKLQACIKRQEGMTTDEVDITIKNGVTVTVEDFQIGVLGSVRPYNQDSALSEPLNIGNYARISFMYDPSTHGTIQQITITPIINKDGARVQCPNSVLVLEQIPLCE